MITRRQALPLLAALPLTGCGAPTYSYRWKLTLELDVDGVTKRGVQVVQETEYTVTFPHSAVRGTTTGQSLYIDLGPGRWPLVTLLTTRDGSGVDPYGAVPALKQLHGVKTEWIGRRNDGLAALIKLRGAKPVKIAQLPELVTFADVGDAATVMAVDPNNLAATLGPGVAWRSMTLEFTDDAVTTGLERKLPWLVTMRGSGGTLEGNVFRYPEKPDDPLASRLNIYDFWSGKR